MSPDSLIGVHHGPGMEGLQETCVRLAVFPGDIFWGWKGSAIHCSLKGLTVA